MLSSSTTNGENRRIQRISLGLPSRIEVKIDQTNTWNEITRLSDLSAFGAGFNLKRPVKRGRLLYMTVPMPRQLRCYDYMEPQYKVWGLVRRCIMTDNRSDRRELCPRRCVHRKKSAGQLSRQPGKALRDHASRRAGPVAYYRGAGHAGRERPAQGPAPPFASFDTRVACCSKRLTITAW